VAYVEDLLFTSVNSKSKHSTKTETSSR